MLSLCGSLICPLCNDFGYCMSDKMFCEYPEYFPTMVTTDHTEEYKLYDINERNNT